MSPVLRGTDSTNMNVTIAAIHTRHRHQHQLQPLHPVLQMVLLVLSLLTAVAVYVTSLMGFVLQTLPVRVDAQVAQK